MSIFETILLGIGLSMDACAVCISNALVYPVLSGRAKRSMPLCFGFFQGVMPLIGYWAGTFCAQFIRLYAGSVTFFILCFIGGKMILDLLSFQKRRGSASRSLVYIFSAFASGCGYKPGCAGCRHWLLRHGSVALPLCFAHCLYHLFLLPFSRFSRQQGWPFSKQQSTRFRRNLAHFARRKIAVLLSIVFVL